MKKLVRVSRLGLTTCPGCACHIQLAEVAKETTCPFCGSSLLEAASPSATSRLLKPLGSGLLAIALLGIPACTTPEPTPDPVPKEEPAQKADPAPESQPDAPPEKADDVKTEPAPEPVNRTLYGVEPRD